MLGAEYQFKFKMSQLQSHSNPKNVSVPSQVCVDPEEPSCSAEQIHDYPLVVHSKPIRRSPKEIDGKKMTGPSLPRHIPIFGGVPTIPIVHPRDPANWVRVIRGSIARFTLNGLVRESGVTELNVLEPVFSGYMDTNCSSYHTLLHQIQSRNVHWDDNLFSLRSCSGVTRNLGWFFWVNDVLLDYGNTLRQAGIYWAVFLSQFNYARDAGLMRALLERWSPDTNTFHTLYGEIGISLWDIFHVGGLPILGDFYDEYVPKNSELYESSTTPSATRELFDIFASHQGKMSYGKWFGEFIESDPSTAKHNRFSNEAAQLRNQGNFKDLGFRRRPGISRLGYLAGFLACWLCSFLFPTNRGEVIRPGTFVMAGRMAEGTMFSLAVPVLAYLYSLMGRLAYSTNPGTFLIQGPFQYIFGWLSIHFERTYSRRTFPSIHDSELPYLAFIGGQAALSFPYGPVAYEFFCHQNEFNFVPYFKKGEPVGTVLVDFSTCSGKQEDAKNLSYMVSIRPGVLTYRSGDKLITEPYTPNRFARQFGFGQIRVSEPSLSCRLNPSLLHFKQYWQTMMRLGTESSVRSPESEQAAPILFAYGEWWSNSCHFIPSFVPTPLNKEQAAPKKRKRVETTLKEDSFAAEEKIDEDLLAEFCENFKEIFGPYRLKIVRLGEESNPLNTEGMRSCRQEEGGIQGVRKSLEEKVSSSHGKGASSGSSRVRGCKSFSGGTRSFEETKKFLYSLIKGKTQEEVINLFKKGQEVSAMGRVCIKDEPLDYPYPPGFIIPPSPVPRTPTKDVSPPSAEPPLVESFSTKPEVQANLSSKERATASHGDTKREEIRDDDSSNSDFDDCTPLHDDVSEVDQVRLQQDPVEIKMVKVHLASVQTLKEDAADHCRSQIFSGTDAVSYQATGVLTLSVVTVSSIAPDAQATSQALLRDVEGSVDTSSEGSFLPVVEQASVEVAIPDQDCDQVAIEAPIHSQAGDQTDGEDSTHDQIGIQRAAMLPESAPSPVKDILLETKVSDHEHSNFVAEVPTSQGIVEGNTENLEQTESVNGIQSVVEGNSDSAIPSKYMVLVRIKTEPVAERLTSLGIAKDNAAKTISEVSEQFQVEPAVEDSTPSTEKPDESRHFKGKLPVGVVVEETGLEVDQSVLNVLSRLQDLSPRPDPNLPPTVLEPIRQAALNLRAGLVAQLSLLDPLNLELMVSTANSLLSALAVLPIDSSSFREGIKDFIFFSFKLASAEKAIMDASVSQEPSVKEEVEARVKGLSSAKQCIETKIATSLTNLQALDAQIGMLRETLTALEVQCAEQKRELAEDEDAHAQCFQDLILAEEQLQSFDVLAKHIHRRNHAKKAFEEIRSSLSS